MQMRETHRPDRLITDMYREIRRTRKRFLSLFLMNLLAVGFLAGLRMTAPDMQRTMDAYYDRQHFMDVRILSALGLRRGPGSGGCLSRRTGRGGQPLF